MESKTKRKKKPVFYPFVEMLIIVLFYFFCYNYMLYNALINKPVRLGVFCKNSNQYNKKVFYSILLLNEIESVTHRRRKCLTPAPTVTMVKNLHSKKL